MRRFRGLLWVSHGTDAKSCKRTHNNSVILFSYRNTDRSWNRIGSSSRTTRRESIEVTGAWPGNRERAAKSCVSRSSLTRLREAATQRPPNSDRHHVYPETSLCIIADCEIMTTLAMLVPRAKGTLLLNSPYRAEIYRPSSAGDLGGY